MTRQKIVLLMICRAGVIGALYVALTLPFGQLAFGPVQIRPAEALTILPLFYPETVVGLYAGCILTNILSAYGIYDILLGSLATLIAGACTFVVGMLIKNRVLKVVIGGFFPIIVNAFCIPAVWLLAGSEVAYWIEFAIMILNEAIWVYGLGIPLFFTFDALIKTGAKGIIPYHKMLKK